MVTEETRDADTALAVQFLVRCIEEQAIRSGTPLDDDTKQLFLHLPMYPIQSSATEDHFAVPNPGYELLCSLTREAYRFDTSINAGSENVWRFAFAALRFAKHPYLQLLKAAGFRDSEPWPVTALFGICVLLAVVLFMGFSFFGDPDFKVQLSLALAGSVMIVLLLLSVDVRKRQLAKSVEEARGKLPLNFKTR